MTLQRAFYWQKEIKRGEMGSERTDIEEMKNEWNERMREKAHVVYDERGLLTNSGNGRVHDLFKLP